MNEQLDDSKRGIYGKYIIEKADGSPIDPDAEYFVLRLDTDVHARVAARAYASSEGGAEISQLAADLIERCDLYDSGQEHRHLIVDDAFFCVMHYDKVPLDMNGRIGPGYRIVSHALGMTLEVFCEREDEIEESIGDVTNAIRAAVGMVTQGMTLQGDGNAMRLVNRSPRNRRQRRDD